MKEAEEDSSIDALLKDMEEEDPEAFAAMQAELEDYEVDPHEVPPDQLSQIFNKLASEKEVGMMTDRGENPFDWDQKKFNKEFDMTGDGQFDLQDVLELGNKTIPYGIYFGSDWTGGFEDKDVSTTNATVKGLNAPAVFKGMRQYEGQFSTAPYLIVYMIRADGKEQFYVFNPQQAFNLDHDKEHIGTEDDDWLNEAILMCANFTPASYLFVEYGTILDEEMGEITKRQVKDTAIKITIEESAQDSLLGRMLQRAKIKNKYAYATKIRVQLSGSINFKERVWDLLFALNHMPMLNEVTFVLTGVMLGKQQKELVSQLQGADDNRKPFYNWKIDTAWLEEEQLMEDYALIEKIKKARNG